MRYIYLLSIISIICFASCSKDKSIADLCANISCQNGGICDNGECFCPNGFTGVFCDSSTIEICDTLTCYNGGSCVDGRCRCVGDYYGDQCQILYDGRGDTIECYTDYPYNPADCPIDHIGPTCTSYIYDIILGAYPANYDNYNNIYTSHYPAELLAGSNSNEFYFQVPQYSTDSILCLRNILQLTIPQQTYNGLTIQGNGDLRITNMYIHVNLDFGDSSNTYNVYFRREASIP